MSRARPWDMFQVVRMLKGKDNLSIDGFVKLNINSHTKGHALKLSKPRVNSRLGLHSFSNRVIIDWNQLKNETMRFQTINSFKIHLKKE